jgi:hypothetical protein
MPERKRVQKIQRVTTAITRFVKLILPSSTNNKLIDTCDSNEYCNNGYCEQITITADRHTLTGKLGSYAIGMTLAETVQDLNPVTALTAAQTDTATTTTTTDIAYP